MSAAAMLVTASATAMRAAAAAIEERERRALAHGHRLAARGEVVAHRHGHVADRHLPWADHRVATDHAADGAVADGDEESLVGDGGQPEQPERRLAQLHAAAVEVVRRAGQRGARRASFAAACRAAYRSGIVDRRVAEQRGRRTDSSPSSVTSPITAYGQRSRSQNAANSSSCAAATIEHVALLRLVAPDLERRHARLVARHLAQLDAAAAAAMRDRLRHGVRQAARAHVVDRAGSGSTSPSAAAARR